MTTLTTLTDDMLVGMYAEGNNEAFDVLLERYQSRLYTYIYYLVHNDSVAEDLFQETFVKVLCCIKNGKYQSAGKFSSWLFRIARNLTLDYHRAMQNEGIVLGEDLTNDFLNASSYSDASHESKLVYNQTLQAVKSLYGALPAAQSEVVHMRFYCDMSFREIADTLGISINTALGRMHYAINNMRKMAEERHISLSI